jgi:RNA-directed DNA polymerase
VAQAEFTSLLREICAPGPAATSGAADREVRREGTEVSRGHSSGEAPSRRPELVMSPSTPQTDASASRPNGRADESREAAGKPGGAPNDLLEQILSRKNLLQAWKRVKANGGAPGLDGMTVRAFPAFARQHWERIRSSLIAGTYHPAAVLRVFIPKPNGDLRPLGIPTVLDRVIQQAIAQVLTPLFDPHFSTHSYGFRGIMLDPLDQELEKRGWRFARYAGDFLVLVKSASAARRVMDSLIRFVETRLGLVVNRQKSQAAPLTRCTFLGFAFRRKQVVWSDKALGRFKERVREITSRRRGVNMSRRLEELRRYAVGWLNYFGISHTYRVVLELDQWIRRRVRLCYWKQWKRPGTRRRHLLSLGIGLEEVHLASRCRRGYWWMSGNGIVQRALDNTWLAEQGVPNLRQQWIELHYGKQNPLTDPASVNLTGIA